MVVKRVVDFVLLERRRSYVVLMIVVVVKLLVSFVVDWIVTFILTFASLRRIYVHFSVVFAVHEMKGFLFTNFRRGGLRRAWNFRTLDRRFLMFL